MDWEPPPLFGGEENMMQDDLQYPTKQVLPNASSAIKQAPLRSLVSSASSSSSSKVVPTVTSTVDEKRMEEERKRMDAMEK